MATNPEQDEFLEDDEQDEIARRSIFSAGWFRALLVLTVLAIVVVVSLPYLLNWLEPTPPPPAKTQAKSSASPPPSSPSSGTTGAAVPAPAPTMVPAPATSAPPAKPDPLTPPAPPTPMPSAKVEEPKPAPAAPPAPSPADRPIGTAPLPVVPAPAAKPGAPAKAAPPTKSAAAPAPAAPETPAAAPKAATAAPKRSAAADGASSGSYWVQVGAFVEEKNAEALAKQIRGENFPVQVSAVTKGGAPVPAPAKGAAGAQNQLFITGSTTDAVNAALKGKGTAQAVKGGIQVNPPFDLETAMSLSSALKKDGFKVVIRRAKGAAPAAPRSTAASGGGPTFHVVRVGGFPDKAKAQQARTELEAKGHPGFLSQGAAR